LRDGALRRMMRGRKGRAMELLQAGGQRVLAVMAAEAEYGPALRRRIRPLMTGVGPVEAGVAAGAALARLAAAGQVPDLILCMGSAGSAVLPRGSVHQVSAVSYRDIDASALGFARGTTPFLALPAEIALPTPWPDLPRARLSTGGAVVTGAAYGAVAAEMVDMETFAVVRAAMAHAIPCIGLRGISDGPGDLHGLADWTALLGHLDAELARALDALLARLAAGARIGAA